MGAARVHVIRCLTLLGWWLAIPLALPAQTAEALPPPAPAVDQAVAPFIPDPVVAAAAPGAVAQDYWVISSRECTSQISPCRGCHFEVLHFDACGRGRVASLDEWLASLQPGVPVCFMTHGSFVDREIMLRDSAATNRWLRRARPNAPLHLAFFTWPSDDLPQFFVRYSINRLGRRASRHGHYLADLIGHVSPDHPISLIGHSHGTRVSAAATHLLAGGVVDGSGLLSPPAYTGHRLRLVFAAAALDHDWLNPGERYELAASRAESIVNLENRRDLALKVYPLRRPFSRRALGAVGFTRDDHEELGPAGPKLVSYELTPYLTCHHTWPHYYAVPEIASVIAPYVYFE